MNRTKEEQYEMPLYKLKKDIPLMKAGAIFYYDSTDQVLGSIGAGCLKLAWTKDGDCQDFLCADTIVFHTNAIRDSEWFERISEGAPVRYVETDLTYHGDTMYRKIEK